MYYDAKWPKSAIWPRDLRWPWPQKRSPRAKDDAQMSQTRIMSIHRLLMRLFPAFCGGKALNGNVKHFVFDLTCDVTGDPEVKFVNFIWKISSRPFHFRLNFSPKSVGFRDRWGDATPPPPPTAEGRGRTRPSRARVKRLALDSTFNWLFLLVVQICTMNLNIAIPKSRPAIDPEIKLIGKRVLFVLKKMSYMVHRQYRQVSPFI